MANLYVVNTTSEGKSQVATQHNRVFGHVWDYQEKNGQVEESCWVPELRYLGCLFSYGRSN